MPKHKGRLFMGPSTHCHRNERKRDCQKAKAHNSIQLLRGANVPFELHNTQIENYFYSSTYSLHHCLKDGDFREDQMIESMLTAPPYGSPFVASVPWETMMKSGRWSSITGKAKRRNASRASASV